VGCETAFSLPITASMLHWCSAALNRLLDIQFWENRTPYWNKLKEYGIKVWPQVKYGKITARGLNLTDKEGKEVFVEADNIELATRRDTG